MHGKERQAAGIAVAKQKGVYKGRKAGTTKADKRRAIDLHRQGFKPSEIANALGISRQATWRYLKSV